MKVEATYVPRYKHVTSFNALLLRNVYVQITLLVYTYNSVVSAASPVLTELTASSTMCFGSQGLRQLYMIKFYVALYSSVSHGPYNNKIQCNNLCRA
jgi:hypothetical protein